MRLLLKLRALKDQTYDLKYHHKHQGFIYRLLDGTPYAKLHDKKGYKFFCFSNIFPPHAMKMGDTRQLLVSSPEVGLINSLNEKLAHVEEEKISVNIGDMSFELKSVDARAENR